MSSPLKQLASFTVLVGSGKGGVGKSTIAVNLAVALARLGARVGLLDADLYGPSIPIMMGLRQVSPPTQISSDGLQHVLPLYKFGVHLLSIGFFVEESRSLVWRGPVLHTALQKMVSECQWGSLDLLIVDLPPGTGDIPLSLAQLLKIDGALIVTTPQEVAMLDAIKAINALYPLDIPILGVVENMAGFTPPGSETLLPLFGSGKGAELAGKFNVPLLASIPLVPSIRIAGDDGCPIAFNDAQELARNYFLLLAEAVSDRLKALSCR